MAGKTKETNAETNVIQFLGRTQYQLYSCERDVIDLTERMLRRLWMKTNTPQRKFELACLIESYRAGQVAISWVRGEPSYIKVVKESTGTPVDVNGVA